MNILLAYICYPPESYDPYGSRLPIGLGYLATALIKAGHGVTIENLSTGGLKELEEILKTDGSNQGFDVAGFSLFTFNRKAVIEATKLIKKLSPETITVVGGPHPTALSQDFPSKYPSIDISVSGPGEGPMVKIMEDIENNDLQQMSSPVTGTDITLPLPESKTHHIINEEPQLFLHANEDLISPALKSTYDGRLHSSREVSLLKAVKSNGESTESQNRLPSDCLDYLGSPSMGMYDSGVRNPDDYIYLNSSRGCRGNCTFCSSPSFWKKQHTFHSTEWVLKELQFRINSIGCDFISFRDESFTSDSTRIRELCEAIILDDSLNFLWDCQCRADQIDEETTDLMALAGCRTVQLGVEHGAESMRRLLGKPCSDEIIIEATSIIRNSGMEASWYLISAIEGETKAERKKTRQFVKTAKPTDAVISPLSIYPGTALFTMMKKQKKLKDDFWFSNKNHWILALPEKEALAIVEKENIAIAHMTKNFDLKASEVKSAMDRIMSRDQATTVESRIWPLIWAYNLALANEGQVDKAKANIGQWKKEHSDQSIYWINELSDELSQPYNELSDELS